MEEHDEIIELLRDDANYFGELGSRFISNSDINVLCNNPDLYGKIQYDDNADYLKGKWLHLRVLEPDNVDSMIVVDATTRNTTAYKEIVEKHTIDGFPKPMFLLKKEIVELEGLARKVELNPDFREGLQDHRKPFEVEEPMIGELFGYQFKGKADRINNTLGFVADFKTTRSLSQFKKNFKQYGYHTQAYIYQELFGMPVRFYVIDKSNGRLGIYDVSPETLQQAEERVKWGLEKLEMYYGQTPTENVEQYYEYLEL
jgi:hypothetical protein